jgi:hypothetical protein
MSRQYVEDLPDHTAGNFCCETAAGSDRLLRRSGSLGFPTPLLRQEEQLPALEQISGWANEYLPPAGACR